MRTARKLARDVVVRRAFEISAVAVIDKILVSWLVCGSDGERTLRMVWSPMMDDAWDGDSAQNSGSRVLRLPSYFRKYFHTFV